MNLNIYKSLVFLSILGWLHVAYAQDDNPMVGIGQWRIHLPYYQGIAVTGNNDKIFCATKYGLFSYRKDDNSIERYSRTNGLSDLAISTIRYSPEDKLLLIAYESSDIDLLYDDNTIVNIPEIKQKNIVSGKSINHILILNHKAYLSCSFGIVVLDLIKKEIKDTWYIGSAGGTLQVNALAYNPATDRFYAATDSGVRNADAHSPFLFNYVEWTTDTILKKTSKYNSIAAYAGKVFTTEGAVTKWVFDGNNWTLFSNDIIDQAYFDVFGGYLILTHAFAVIAYNKDLQDAGGIGEIDYPNGKPYRGYLDRDNNFWVADKNYGLVKTRDRHAQEYISPNGPAGQSAYAMDAGSSGIWVAGGAMKGSGCGDDPKGVYWFNDNQWKSFYQANDALYKTLNEQNLVSVAVDPNNGNHAFFGSCRSGVMEFNENGGVNIYDSTNSPLQAIKTYKTPEVWTGGVAYDKNGNLWVLTNLNSRQLTRRSPNGTWDSFTLGNDYATTEMYNLWIDSYDQKWINVKNIGYVVFKEKDASNPTDRVLALASKDPQNGEWKPNLAFNAWAEDKNGALWFGSAEGVFVMYNPADVFKSPYGERIRIEQDGHIQFLLETENVLSIAVDGANRKWFGTSNSGVYLMSADGTKLIHHFDESNSPLLSNTVKSLAIDPVTGEVFFGTELGICSFRGDATEGKDYCNDYYVFPNPVKHEYRGPIAIKGLVKNASVKIADISGQVVYQTKANGGEAIWDGNNFSGERAKTGVYVVYVTNDDGSQTCVTKMMFIN